MSQSLVYCAPDTRAYMAAPIIANGIRSVVPTNHDGTPVQQTGLKFSGPDPSLTETFVDLISGERFAKITPAQAAELDPDLVFSGAGSVVGLFTQVYPDEVEEISDGSEESTNGAAPRKASKKATKKAA